MAFVYVPNGMDMRHWNPSYEGKLADLPQTLQPLEAHKDDILLMGNLTHNTGRALLDGAGDHGRCSGSYLTGVQVKKSVSDIKASVSCDQLVANQIGQQTRFASLEVGLEDGRQAGDCDSGYPARTRTISRGAARRSRCRRFSIRARCSSGCSATARSSRPKCASSAGSTGAASSTSSGGHACAPRHARSHGSAQARRISQLDPPNRRAAEARRKRERARRSGMEKPYGIPSDFAEHFRLMTDMITVAFQADLTRVVTFLVTREGTSRAYREIGIPDGHHPLTHHRNVREMMDKVAKINRTRWSSSRMGDEAEVCAGRRRIDPR